MAGTEDLFDFGFTAVDETELKAYQDAEKLKAEADSKLSAAENYKVKLISYTMRFNLYLIT